LSDGLTAIANIQLEIGWQSGHLREQARSHSGIGGSQLETGRLSGRLREQDHSYRKAKQSRQTACPSPLMVECQLAESS
jgi:hypothetical protein